MRARLELQTLCLFSCLVLQLRELNNQVAMCGRKAEAFPRDPAQPPGPWHRDSLCNGAAADGQTRHSMGKLAPALDLSLIPVEPRARKWPCRGGTLEEN